MDLALTSVAYPREGEGGEGHHVAADEHRYGVRDVLVAARDISVLGVVQHVVVPRDPGPC